MDCKLVSPPLQFHAKILTPNVMGLGGGVFGRSLGQENEALVDEISAFIPLEESSLTPSIM